MEDKRLIVRSQHGDHQAFCRLYEKYRNVLFKVAVALLRDTAAAEDAVQDVFVRFAENIGRFRLTGSLKAYLCVCVANRAKNMLASQNKDAALQTALSNIPNRTETNDRFVANEQLELLSRALAKLPIEQREILVLRYYSQMRFSAIASSLEIPLNTAKSRYRYGMDKLRQILNDEVIT